jgi:hypothetical protein
MRTTILPRTWPDSLAAWAWRTSSRLVGALDDGTQLVVLDQAREFLEVAGARPVADHPRLPSRASQQAGERGFPAREPGRASFLELPMKALDQAP